MDVYFSVACITLRSIVAGITLLNELVLLSSQWIISPSHPSTPFPHPLFTSAAYAFAEPLYTILIAQIGVQAWISLLNTPQHVLVCQFSIDYIIHLLNSRSSSSTKHPEPREPHEAREKGDRPASEIQSDHHEPQSKWKTHFAVLFPVQSAAASNAALVLFAVDLGPSFRNENANVTLFFSVLATFFYLGSRYADFTISHRTYKVSLWKPRSYKNLKLQLSCLVLLLSLKIGIRILLGLHPFPLLQDIGSTEVRPILGHETPTWVETLRAWTPTWFPFASAILSPPLTWFGYRLTQQAWKD